MNKIITKLLCRLRKKRAQKESSYDPSKEFFRYLDSIWGTETETEKQEMK